MLRGLSTGNSLLFSVSIDFESWLFATLAYNPAALHISKSLKFVLIPKPYKIPLASKTVEPPS